MLLSRRGVGNHTVPTVQEGAHLRIGGLAEIEVPLPHRHEVRRHLETDHLVGNLTGAANIAKRYTQDQAPSAGMDAEAAFAQGS